MALLQRGATETCVIRAVGVDLTGFTVHVAFGHSSRRGCDIDYSRPHLVVTDEQMVMVTSTEQDEHGEEVPVTSLAFTLTQEQSLMLRGETNGMQIRVVDGDTADVSTVLPLSVAGVIERGVIPDAH